ncbi:hypothetical protein BDN71DRAFT_1455144, partial [Pleurotus eryngii]
MNQRYATARSLERPSPALPHLHPLCPSPAARVQRRRGLGSCRADDWLGSSTRYNFHIEGSYFVRVSLAYNLTSVTKHRCLD